MNDIRSLFYYLLDDWEKQRRIINKQLRDNDPRYASDIKDNRKHYEEMFEELSLVRTPSGNIVNVRDLVVIGPEDVVGCGRGGKQVTYCHSCMHRNDKAACKKMLREYDVIFGADLKHGDSG